MTTTNTRLTGYEAIVWAERYETANVLCKYADPTEDFRSGVSVAEAREIATADPSLIYVDVPTDEIVANFRDHLRRVLR